MLELAKYSRKPFVVDAAQVTQDNIKEVAAWCGGEVQEETGKTGETSFVKVPVARALNEKQTKAYVGDWVLYAGTGYKVYTNKAFQNGFDALDGTEKDAVTQAQKG